MEGVTQVIAQLGPCYAIIIIDTKGVSTAHGSECGLKKPFKCIYICPD